MGKAITKAKEIAAEAAQTADKAAGGENIDQTKETATAGTNDATEAAVEQAPAVTLDELESMDMSAFTEDETEDGPRPAWRITDDGCADWACRKIAEERAELARIRELAEAQIARKMKQDDTVLVQFLKASGNLEFIKTEEKPKWGDYKKRLEIVGGSVVDKETGEIVEGVPLIEKPDTFAVDV